MQEGQLPVGDGDVVARVRTPPIVAITAFVIAPLYDFRKYGRGASNVATGTQIKFFRQGIADMLGAQGDEVSRFPDVISVLWLGPLPLSSSHASQFPR